VVMGDVHEQRLEDIWRNERFAHYRHALATSGRRGLPLCEQCSYSGHGVRKFFPLSYATQDPVLARLEVSMDDLG